MTAVASQGVARLGWYVISHTHTHTPLQHSVDADTPVTPTLMVYKHRRERCHTHNTGGRSEQKNPERKMSSGQLQL